VISAGVAAGDRVVVDGQSRLFPGAVMKIARTVDARVPQGAPGAARAADAERVAAAAGGAATATAGN